MLRRLVAFVSTTIAILLLLVSASHVMATACFPFEAHTLKWQCELIIASLGISFALPTAIYGYFAMRSPWMEGAAVSLLAAFLAAAMSYFQPFFGGSFSPANATSTVYYAVLPGIVGALAGFKLRTFAQPSRDHSASDETQT